jgi:hypothetical protein
MKSIKILGEQILVEKVLSKNTAIDTNGVFKGVVTILQFGEKLEDRQGLEVGDKVLMREHCVYGCIYTKESYIDIGGILRTVV